MEEPREIHILFIHAYKPEPGLLPMSGVSLPFFLSQQEIPVLKAIISLLLLGSLSLNIIACGERATLPVEAGMGPRPTLPAPNPTLIPTVNIARAKGWPDGAKPTAAAGLSVNAYATGLDHPRWLYVLPNGDVLVAETNAPPKESKGIKDWIMKLIMKRAGAGVPSANRITLLRDSDGDGIAEMRTVFLQGLNSPFGMALVQNDFYVANTDALDTISVSTRRNPDHRAGCKDR